jgi:heat-inducible transcriptional repressor
LRGLTELLDQRKLKILAAVVDEYIVTGEPVGSKAIAALPGINASPATIRNDMAMLEQLGYLEQPHTSAGRIPTFNGYKLYIGELMPSNTLSDEEKRNLDGFIEADLSSANAIIENASKALAEFTDCAAVIKNISPQFSVITKVELIPTGKRMYVLLLITSTGNIKNKVCRLEFDLTNEQLDFFTKYVAENLQGLAIENLSEEMLQNLVSAMGTYMVTLSPLLKGVYELAAGFKEDGVQVKGEKNLLARRDIDAAQLVSFLERKNEISKLLDDSFDNLQVLFGENGDFIVNNSSMIMSRFKKDGKVAGALGVLGPMRLDYAKIIPYIKYLTDRISDIISEKNEDE